MKTITLRDMINEVKLQEIVSRACSKGGSVGQL